MHAHTNTHMHIYLGIYMHYTHMCIHTCAVWLPMQGKMMSK